MPLTVTTENEAATQALAAGLARLCRPGDCLALTGDLGAGKTAFARGFIASLVAAPVEVTSPTFNLVQAYEGRDFTIWHFDLYRLKDARELVELGLDDALMQGVTLIEWPALARQELPVSTLDVAVSIGNNPAQRTFTFAGDDKAWQERLTILKDMQ